MGRTAKHKTRNDSDAKPPSVFAEMPTISLLEAVVTKDPRWHWLEAAWDASDDESVRELAGHVRRICAQPGGSSSEEPVIVDPESE